LHLTALSLAEFEVGFAIVKSWVQEGTLQSRAAGELSFGGEKKNQYCIE
jgi:hypothetical protein